MTVHVMSLAQYLEMWSRITRWQSVKRTKNLPNYVTISNFNVGLDKVTKAQFLDMFNRMKEYMDSHQGAMAQRIGIEGPAPVVTPIKPAGPIEAYAEAKLGSFTTMTEFYNKIKGRGYKKYYNDVKTRHQTIDAVAGNDMNNKPNCTDIMQVFHDLAIEKGYECRYVHVQCKEGGHIRGQIRGREFKDWTRVDPAAALSVGSQYPIGKVWCDYSNAHIENSAWLNMDDGR